MQFTNPYWSNRLKISTLQRWVLVHSILYYELNKSIVNDATFDSNAYQLAELQRSFPEEAKASQYYYVFYDFDGTTGFDLYHRLTKKDKEWHMHIANHVLSLHKAGGKKHESKRR